MNRLSTALVPALMTGALLGISAASKAQTNIIELSGNVPGYVVPGQTFSLQMYAIQNNPNAKTVTVQSIFRTDNGLAVTWTRSPDLNPFPVISEAALRTATITGGEYAGVNTFLATTYGFSPARTLAPRTLIGTYTITLKEGASGFIDFGLAQSSVAGNGLIQAPNLSTTFRSGLTTSNPVLQSTSFLGSNFQDAWMLPDRPGSYRVTVVPEPSGIFALGLLTPAVALLRRRRKTS